MCLRNGRDELILGGCEDGSVVLWDIRRPDKELNAIKLFTETGKTVSRSYNNDDHPFRLTRSAFNVVMCLGYNIESNHGISGSPLKSLETFRISEEVTMTPARIEEL